MVSNPRSASKAQEYRLRHKRASVRGSRRLGKAPSIYILDRVPRSCASGLFPWAAALCSAHARKNMSQHIFQSSSELQNIPEAAPKASPSFSVSEKLALYGSSSLSGIEHLRLLVGKDSVADALIRHFGSLKALSRASFRELRQFLTRRQAEAVIAALSMGTIAETEYALLAPLTNAKAIYKANLDMKAFHQEVVRVVLLDSQLRCITKVEISKGTVDASFACR